MRKISMTDYKYIRIIEERKLVSYSKLILSPAKLDFVVMFETEDELGIAFRDSANQLFVVETVSASWHEQINEQRRKRISYLYNAIVADDQRIVVRLLADGHTWNEFTEGFETLPIISYMEWDGNDLSAAQTSWETSSRYWLSFIREHSAPEDCYGIYGAFGSALWWWEEKTRVLHIMGAATVNLPEDKAWYYESYANGKGYLHVEQGHTHPDCIACCCGWERKISRLMIHEGIKGFSHVPLMNRGWGFEIEELILPSTLRIMPLLMCHAEIVTVPETVDSINLEEQWIDCGGHFDPVEYAIRSLRLPSDIEIDVDLDDEDYHGQLPLLEPISYWEEIVLYGKDPIHDLERWYKSNVFLCDIDILYPASWDEGKEIRFTDRVVSYVRGQKPMYGEMSGMDSEWFDWKEEDYEALRGRIRPYSCNSI